MKNRKTVVVAFMLVAAMLLGVGYAALSDTLTITGDATVNKSGAQEAFNEDIYFSDAVANQTGNTASVDTDDNDKATFKVESLKGQGDTATFTFTIKNAGDVNASVAVPTITNSNETYFTITTDWGNDAKALAAGDSINVVVTITLVKTPTNDEGQTATFGIGFTATTA
jgi:hypothetical protein